MYIGIVATPVTRTELDTALARLRTEFREDLQRALDAQTDKFTATVRDVQTHILRAFLPSQESVSLRFRKLEADTANLNVSLSERMAVVERRLMEIEKRLLIDPPTAA